LHIPDGFLSPHVWGTLDVVSGCAVAIGLRQTSQSLKERTIPLMGVLSAFVFAAQMVNVPVAGGTSGHFLGGTLVGVLLGSWSGLVLMTVVLIVQCFLFQDGGVAALGANIFNMGIIGSFLSAGIYRVLYRMMPGSRKIFWSGLITALLTVVLSALSCAWQLAASNVITLKLGFLIIGGVHGFVGLLEGIVTGTILESVARMRPDLMPPEHA
jgi:cobalt/nickel transport system permease protein